MNYENAPATRMLATQCAVCRRPLVDALSVETGIGPNCRKKYGFDVPCNPFVRGEVNQVIHDIAVGNLEGGPMMAALKYIGGLGFEKLAAIIGKRVAVVAIEEKDGRIFVDAPFKPEALEAFRALPGRRFDVASKRWHVPATEDAKRAAWNLLKRFYAGAVGTHANGSSFWIPAGIR
jgi:hypothetical protein